MNFSVSSSFLTTCLILYICVQNGFSAEEEEEESSEENEEAKDGLAILNGSSSGECGLAVNLGVQKTLELKSPNFDSGKPYGDNISCKYIVIGTPRCIPSLKCSLMDLRENADCAAEHLRISDGIGGETILCHANATQHTWQASLGYRDLFITFKTGVTQKLGQIGGHKGFSCTLTCLKPGNVTDKALPLEGKAKRIAPCACGLQNKNDRIVGGMDVNLGEFPWQVALVGTGTRKPFCGGTLINNKFVLTAAHCFFFTSATPKDIEVLLRAQVLDFKLNEDGKTLGGLKAKDTPFGEMGSIQGPGWQLPKTTDATEGTLRLKVSKIISHPLFTSKFDSDACLLELAEPIRLVGANAPTPVCLPELGKLSNKFTGENATIVGWGKGLENAGSNNRLLQKLDVPVLDLILCNVTIPYPLTRRMLCAGFMTGGKDACTGDSGGPLIHQKQGYKAARYEQIGVVSWGEGCARKNRPGLYSRVSEFNQWIHYHASEVGARWCSSPQEE